MRDPGRAVTRDRRTRGPERRGREQAERLARTWPESIRGGEVMTRAAVTARWPARWGSEP
jgi:hypothetical protein